MNKWIACLAAGFCLALSGCGSRVVILTQDSGENGYLRAEHPFTDAAEAELKQRSERLCAERKKQAIKTQSACSLTKCVTTYQCSDQPGLMKN